MDEFKERRDEYGEVIFSYRPDRAFPKAAKNRSDIAGWIKDQTNRGLPLFFHLISDTASLSLI